MLGRRQKQKYEVVDTADNEVECEMEAPAPKKIFTPVCLKVSLLKGLLIAIYFAPSMGLTFYQRWLLQEFRYPLSTVLIHMIVKYVLAAVIRFLILLKFGRQRMPLGWKDYTLSMAPTGIFSGIDIGFSNWGLELITISLYTMTKSTVIIFILGFAILFKLEKKSWSLCTIVIMISTGLLLFTYKATQFNINGFMLVLVASMSSGVRWTCVQLLLQKSKLGMKNPIDMIYHMQPFMIVSLLPFVLFIEGFSLLDYLTSIESAELQWRIEQVLIGAFIAFFMEISEVMVVTYTSSLTLSIAGIFKEILMLILAVEYNGDKISGLNVLGLVICLCGIACHVVHKIRNAQMHAPAGPKSFDCDPSDRCYESGKALMEDHEIDLMSVSSDGLDEDSQVLFNIINRHDR